MTHIRMVGIIFVGSIRRKIFKINEFQLRLGKGEIEHKIEHRFYYLHVLSLYKLELD